MPIHMKGLAAVAVLAASLGGCVTQRERVAEVAPLTVSASWPESFGKGGCATGQKGEAEIRVSGIPTGTTALEVSLIHPAYRNYDHGRAVVKVTPKDGTATVKLDAIPPCPKLYDGDYIAEVKALAGDLVVAEGVDKKGLRFDT